MKEKIEKRKQQRHAPRTFLLHSRERDQPCKLGLACWIALIGGRSGKLTRRWRLDVRIAPLEEPISDGILHGRAIDFHLIPSGWIATPVTMRHARV